MSIRAGHLRHRVTFESPPTALDERGAIVGSWTVVATVWASVEQLAGGESTPARKQVATTSLAVKVRSQKQLDAVTPKHRLRWRGKLLFIAAINRNELETIELSCGEYVG